MPRKTITKDKHHNNLPIQTGKANGNGSVKEILDGYHSRLEYMTNKHKQTSVMHLVVSTHEDIDPKVANSTIGRSISSLRKSMKYNGIETQIGWVREQSRSSADEDSGRLHFHIGIIADGSLTQSAIKHAKQLDRLWNRHTGDASRAGYVHYCKPAVDEQDLTSYETATAIKIRRDKPDADKQFANAFNWLTYPAQNVQKGGPYRGKGFAFTRIPKDQSKKES
jgi:hypothetical protein